MTTFPLLSTLIFLPLIGALFVSFVRGDNDVIGRNVTLIAIWVTGFACLICGWLLWHFNPTAQGYQFTEIYPWIPSAKINYALGIDGISIFFLPLSVLLFLFCFLFNFSKKINRIKEYTILFLMLETCVLGVFCATDTVLFYLFFEASVVPLFFIIGLWGGENRLYATFKFFIYTLFGSLFMLAALIILLFIGQGDHTIGGAAGVPPEWQYALWLCFFFAFAIKMPMWPFHTWLPDAHVEAPTTGSVILAGILLKLGGYGMIRFNLCMLPQASDYFAPLVWGMSLIGIIATALIALVQDDIKKLIAYSSVSHMGYVTLGLFVHHETAITGALYQMLSHGIISAALFFGVGVIYDRWHTRNMNQFGGIATIMPRFATLYMIIVLGSLGLPLTTGFIGEFMILIGTYSASLWLVATAGLGMIFGALYNLVLYRRTFFGKVSNIDGTVHEDINHLHAVIFATLAGMVVWFGIQPGYLIMTMHNAVRHIITIGP